MVTISSEPDAAGESLDFFEPRLPKIDFINPVIIANFNSRVLTKFHLNFWSLADSATNLYNVRESAANPIVGLNLICFGRFAYCVFVSLGEGMITDALYWSH